MKKQRKLIGILFAPLSTPLALPRSDIIKVKCGKASRKFLPSLLLMFLIMCLSHAREEIQICINFRLFSFHFQVRVFFYWFFRHSTPPARVSVSENLLFHDGACWASSSCSPFEFRRVNSGVEVWSGNNAVLFIYAA